MKKDDYIDINDLVADTRVEKNNNVVEELKNSPDNEDNNTHNMDNDLVDLTEIKNLFSEDENNSHERLVEEKTKTEETETISIDKYGIVTKKQDVSLICKDNFGTVSASEKVDNNESNPLSQINSDSYDEVCISKSEAEYNEQDSVAEQISEQRILSNLVIKSNDIVSALKRNDSKRAQRIFNTIISSYGRDCFNKYECLMKAFHYAIYKNDKTVIKFILNKAKIPIYREKNGISVFLIASYACDLETIKMLIRHAEQTKQEPKSHGTKWRSIVNKNSAVRKKVEEYLSTIENRIITVI